MPTYIAFLRAINLGAKRVFTKDDIRRAVESVGFTDVATHINTGNVRFDTRMRSRPRIEEALEEAFLADRGFDVPTMVFTASEIREVAADAAELGERHPGLARHYVYFMKDPLTAGAAAEVEATSSAKGDMVVRGRVAHALLKPGYRAGEVDPLGAAPLLKSGTSRNATVVAAVADKWC